MGAIPGIQSLTDVRNLLTIVTFVALTVLGLYGLRRLEKQGRIVLFGLSLMIFPFIPASNLFFPVGFVIAERVLYIPSMGFTMVVGYGAWLILNKLQSTTSKALLQIGLIYLVVSHATKTVIRNHDWESNLSLFKAAVRIEPCRNNAKMPHNLASSYQTEADDFPLAEVFFKYTTEMDPLYISAHMHLGYALMKQEKYDEAIQVIFIL